MHVEEAGMEEDAPNQLLLNSLKSSILSVTHSVPSWPETHPAQFLTVHAKPKLAQTLQRLQGPREEVKTDLHQPGNAWPYTHTITCPIPTVYG